MKLFGYEIRKIPTQNPGFVKQKDLYFVCPVCGRFTKIRRLPDDRTILTALWGIDKLNKLELECPCGAKIVILSKEEVFEVQSPVDWAKIVEKVVRR